MRTTIIISAFLLLVLTSCFKSNLFREFYEFKNYTWNRFEKVEFKVPIEQEGITGDIIVSIRHLEQYPYNEVPMHLIMKTPSGEERIIEHSMNLKDESGNFVGSVAGSYWDVEEIIWKNFTFNTVGEYLISIENINPRPGIPALVDIGLIIKKK